MPNLNQQKSAPAQTLRKNLGLKKIEKCFVGILSFGLVIAVLAVFSIFTYLTLTPKKPCLPKTISTSPDTVEVKFQGLKPFKTEQEFKKYLEQSDLASQNNYGFSFGGARKSVSFTSEVGLLDTAQESRSPVSAQAPSVAPDRVSETNVQVLGIDEPDIVKTDGQQIYFSGSQNYYWTESVREPGINIDMMPPQKLAATTKIISAFPPANLAVKAKVDKRGNLLLFGKTLVVFTDRNLYGYDVSDSSDPKESWSIEYKNNNYLITARSFKNKIYLITRQEINRNRPCPIEPLASNNKTVSIACDAIYHPINAIPADVTYNALVIDPKNGNIDQQIALVGSYDNSAIYMSTEALYIAHSYFGDFIQFYYNFIATDAKDLFPELVLSKIQKLMGYDISQQSKLSELQSILENYSNSLDNDEKLKLENETANRLQDYFASHKRELERTGLAKIGLNDFKIKATGEAPGRPLNQFSLDEYKGNLRIATTIGNNFWLFGGSGDSANDVYVLSADLKIIGAVTDLGLTERIYSARFVKDQAYLVTFRQTDPFYVLDLSNPEKPELKGELKIPGYSAYLHPLGANRILGVGKEGSQVKISLFDVSDPSKPAEAAKYLLDEYWSDILNTHHAFLADEKHEIFFMPGNKGGYVFSYAKDRLSLQKAVSDIVAQRAVYINDYLYVIGDNKISILDETTWERVKDLEL